MIYKAPDNLALRDPSRPSVFLAGSIEMGAAADWQTEITPYFDNLGWDVFNPRRDEWDSSWEQTHSNPHFYQQVNWELAALEKATHIFLYLDPNTKSPISLLEFGLYARSSRLYVICPLGFYRRGNIEIVCDKYDVPLFSDFESAKIAFIK